MVGFALLEEVALLETTPLASTPTTVNVYVLLGVTPLGLVFWAVVLPQAGIRKSAALITKSASSPHAFPERFPPIAAPRPTSASIGKGSQSP